MRRPGFLRDAVAQLSRRNRRREDQLAARVQELEERLRESDADRVRLDQELRTLGLRYEMLEDDASAAREVLESRLRPLPSLRSLHRTAMQAVGLIDEAAAAQAGPEKACEAALAALREGHRGRGITSWRCGALISQLISMRGRRRGAGAG